MEPRRHFVPHGFLLAREAVPMTPDDYCQQKAAASGSSFYYSFLFLPPERRRAITAVYAYCREVDDAVDEVSDPSVAEAGPPGGVARSRPCSTGSPRIR